jgi:hypothetical protein
MKGKTKRQLLVFPKFREQAAGNIFPRANFREHFFESKFSVPDSEKDRDKFSISFPKTGTGKSWCLVSRQYLSTSIAKDTTD